MMDLSQLRETCFPLSKIPQLPRASWTSITGDKTPHHTKIPKTHKQSTYSSILLNTFWHANATFPTTISVAAHIATVAHSHNYQKKPSFKPFKMSIFLWYSPLTHIKFQPFPPTRQGPRPRRFWTPPSASRK